ncbi:MAG: monovalent cation/H+ antiporter subunit D family protein [Methanocellales archaeon]|nr:monovalent cation/H+ antiporter subunit D family protein [Methanocellales archaeon]
MEPVYSIRPVLAIAVSLACAFLIVLTGEKRRNLREFWTLAASVLGCTIVVSMFPHIYHGGEYIFTMVSIVPGVGLDFRVDAFGMFFAFLSSFLWIFTSIYSIGYMRALKEHAQTRYYFAFAACIASAVGIAFAGNLLTLFIFYEMLTISAFPLVIHEETPEALYAGKKYLAYTLSGGALVLLGMAIAYTLAGTLTFTSHGFLAGHGSAQMLKILFAIFIMGFGVKAAIIPLHSWLPSAMVAPTPVSALLHAVAVVNAGIFGIVRVVCSVYGIELVASLGLGLPLAIVASITIIVGSLFALAQDNLKLMLAYSTVSQLSYIILGAALLSPSALSGGVVHIAHQGFMKITLFFCAGAILVQTGKRNMSEMNGIGRKMPLTMMGFTMCAFGMIGTPPMCGFITKWYLGLGALEAGHPIFIVVLLASALLNAAYYLPPVYNAFFKEPDASLKGKEASWWLLAPILVCAAISLMLGIIPTTSYMPLQLARTFLGIGGM